MARLTPRFSANRSVGEYTDQYYLPAATAYRLRSADNGAIGKQIAAWQKNLQQKWAGLRFGRVKVESRDEQHIFEVALCLKDLDPRAVRVELCANGESGSPPARQEMTRLRPLAEEPGFYLYSATVPASRASGDYTPRVTPYFDGASTPLEEARILWQR